MKTNFGMVIAALSLAGCRASVDGSIRAGGADARVEAPGIGHEEPRQPEPPRPEPILTPDPAQPAFVFLNASAYAVAVEVNDALVVYGRKLTVTDGTIRREAHLIEPGGRVRVPLDGPGSWSVKTLCYFRRGDDGFQLYGGRTEYRSQPGAYTITGSMYCGPIEAARTATASSR